MHLHGHLASCIRDYGPVYAFWLFSFERFNGILGSYHVNNHEISIQVMRHFINHQIYRSDNWSTEFREDFIPLISKAIYCKGSLMYTTLEDSFSSVDCMKQIQPLPPTTEYVLDSNTKQYLLNNLCQHYSESCFDVSLLCKKSKAIKINSFVLGSERSKFRNSSRLLVNTKNNQTQLVQVNCFLQCVVLQTNIPPQPLWLAAISNFESHPCSVWFGHPVQVWSCVVINEEHFLPISLIASREYTQNRSSTSEVILENKKYWPLFLLTN